MNVWFWLLSLAKWNKWKIYRAVAIVIIFLEEQWHHFQHFCQFCDYCVFTSFKRTCLVGNDNKLIKLTIDYLTDAMVICLWRVKGKRGVQCQFKANSIIIQQSALNEHKALRRPKSHGRVVFSRWTSSPALTLKHAPRSLDRTHTTSCWCSIGLVTYLAVSPLNRYFLRHSRFFCRNNLDVRLRPLNDSEGQPGSPAKRN